jgi:hypothetical protein
MMARSRQLALFLCSFAVLLAGNPPVWARPPYKKALADYFGPYLAAKLNDCRTCHLPDSGKDDPLAANEKPHNVFGARLKAIKRELSKTGKSTSITARLEAIAEEDSDGDGVPNLLELLTGHFPGDPNDKPTDAEITAGRKVMAEFLKTKTGYPWSPFDTVRRPAIPAVKNMAWVCNPIDAFIAKEHEERGLKPRPGASKTVLLRRVYLDLTGLPPTPGELHAYLADDSSNAYEKVLDRLLDSPRYGERWGRHWMDVWRYSDWAGWTDGGQIRDSQPHIWRWRDWIVESLNADKGYDRMVLEMLAGDELAPNDESVLRATGYLVRNYKMLSREKWMQDTVEHTAMAFLGVTLGCARCHDHMYDPILQKEYYQVRAIFEPHQVRLDRRPAQPDTKKDGLPRAYDADPGVPTFLFIRGDDRNPDKSKPLPPGVPEALGGRFPGIEPVSLPLTAHAPDKRDFVIDETLAAAAAEVSRTHQALAGARQRGIGIVGPPNAWLAISRFVANAQALDELGVAEIDAPLAEVRQKAIAAAIAAERLEDEGKKDSDAWKSAATIAATAQRQQAVLEARRNLLVARQGVRAGKAETIKKVADAEKALAHTEANAKQQAGTNYTKRPIPNYPASSSGRRLAFARWLTDRSNPLTARVAMNHIWMRHFGQAIVPSVTDFGRNGRPPSHPALLDWLAAEFMERGWSMKQMHRLIVTSNTYRMASTPDEANLAIDRDNIYLWRMNSHRLEAEVVRDCIFYVGGKLDLTMGGPDIPHQKGLTIPRRSIYFQHAQEKQMEFLKIFDEAAVTECYRRKESVVPQQALALNNSELVLTQARLLARALSEQVGSDPAAFATAAFERVLSRPPMAEEQAECVAFLQQRTRQYTNGNEKSNDDAAARARESLMHVLLNHSDFVTMR